jgi:hypothetical protein
MLGLNSQSYPSKIAGRGPYDFNSPEEYLGRIPSTVSEYYNPYIQGGIGSQEDYSQISRLLALSPEERVGDLMSKYTESPYYKTQRDMLSQAAANTAAAGGYRGNMFDRNQQMGLQQALLSKGMQEWLGNVFGAQKLGMEGLSSLYRGGLDAARGLSGD